MGHKKNKRSKKRKIKIRLLRPLKAGTLFQNTDGSAQNREFSTGFFRSDMAETKGLFWDKVVTWESSYHLRAKFYPTTALKPGSQAVNEKPKRAPQ